MKFIEITYDLLLATLIIFTPLAFGSVHIWAFSLAEIISFTLFALWLLKILIDTGYDLDRRLLPLAICAGLFISLSLLMLVPLPRSLISAISPSAHELYRNVIEGYAGINSTEYITRALSISPHLTLKSILKSLAYMGVFFSAVHELRDERRMKRIVLLIMAIGFSEALYGLTMLFHNKLSILGFERTGSVGAWGTFVNKNHFAGYVGMASLIGFGYLTGFVHLPRMARNARQYITEFFSNFRSTLTSLILIAVGLMALGISFSNSRMGVIAMLASLLLMLTVLSISRKKKRAMFFVAVLIVISFTVWMFGTGHLESRFDGAWENLKESRLVLWNSTMELLRDYSLVGSGLGTYRAAFQLYTPTGWTSITKQAHNDYLEILSETGVAGSAVALLALTFYLFLFSSRWKDNREAKRATVSLGAFCAVFYILVFSLSDFNLQIPSNALLFSLSMALSLAQPSTAPGANGPIIAGPYRQAMRRAVASGLLLLILPASFLSLQQWRAERLFPVERTFIRAGEAPEITSYAEAEKALRASDLFPGNETYHILLGLYHEHEARVPGTQEDKRLEQLDMAIDELITALEMNPSSLNALGHLAWAEFSKGDFLSATRHLDTLLDIAPTNYFSHLFYAQAVTGFINAYPESMRRPYLYKASREFEKGIEMNPLFSRSSHILADMAAAFMKLGDKEEAVKRLDMIRDYAPWTLPHIVKAARIHLDAGRHKEGTDRYRRMYLRHYKGDASRRNIVKFLEKDVVSRPELHELRALLIKLMLDQKDWDGAIRVMQGELGKGVRPDATIYYEMGRAYESGGNMENAKDMYINAIKAGNGHKQASKRLVGLIQGKI